MNGKECERRCTKHCHVDLVDEEEIDTACLEISNIYNIILYSPEWDRPLGISTCAWRIILR
jgi:hypothetical protein